MGTRRGTPGEITVTIEGYDLPGRHCDPHDTDAVYADVHVGVQRRKEVVDLVPGDAPSARWTFVVTTKIADDDTVDFGGPYVHGRRGDRFLYLSWGAAPTGTTCSGGPSSTSPTASPPCSRPRAGPGPSRSG